MTGTEGWLLANQRYLSARVARVCAALERYTARQTPPDTAQATTRLPELPASGETPYALEGLVDVFSLSPFEADVLVLCAAVELDSRVPSLCAAALADGNRHPTFGLCLAALPEAHWSALLPSASLRRFRLIELERGDLVTQSPLRIDERVLHFLCGIPGFDERLAPLLEPIAPPRAVPPSQEPLVESVIAAWSRAATATSLLELSGIDPGDRRVVAAAACGALGLSLYRMRASEIITAASEREAFARLWDREALLLSAALLVEIEPHDTAETERAATAFTERVRGPVLVSSREPLMLGSRPVIRLGVKRPSSGEQLELWRAGLGAGCPLNGQLARTVSRFSLGTSAILSVSERVRAEELPPESEQWQGVLFRACREEARPRFDDLAQPIEPAASWQDLVLPHPQQTLLEQIATQVRHRTKVYDEWGFGERGERGMGITALFVGPSGTGKTLAAEVLARDLGLDLYRVDLSRVVSKYIGETEKNLRRVFDSAESGSVVLLFDEADSLFGKRSEVKDSHDRYANIEVGYLLQRMEVYRGLAILTTNMKQTVDEAFLRRIRFVVDFPFPDARQRQLIWSRMFPAKTPTDALNLQRLARFNLAGGNIRNIAMNAAFLAADSGEPVRMPHVIAAAHAEYDKLERPFPEQEWRGSA